MKLRIRKRKNKKKRETNSCFFLENSWDEVVVSNIVGLGLGLGFGICVN